MKCGGALSLSISSQSTVALPSPALCAARLCRAPRKHYNSDGGNLESQFYTGPAATSNNILHYCGSGTEVTNTGQDETDRGDPVSFSESHAGCVLFFVDSDSVNSVTADGQRAGTRPGRSGESRPGHNNKDDVTSPFCELGRIGIEAGRVGSTSAVS